MQQPNQTAEETLKDIATFHPPLAKLLRAFSPLLCAAEKLQQELALDFKANPWPLPPLETSRFQNGISWLADFDFPEAKNYLLKAREDLWPHFANFPALQSHLDPYYSFWNNLTLQEEALIWRSVLQNDANILAPLDLPDSTVLHFMATFICQSLLKGLVLSNFEVQNLAATLPWDAYNTWQQGYCPVCGSYPTLAWLDKAVVDERNPFLLEGGGKKHLHCGVCGANWRFLRLSCPNCGVAESKQIEIMTCADDTHGESLDWCNKCNFYLPTIDLRERPAIPNFEAQALGMLPLELLAKEQNLKPLRLSFWNSLS